MAAMRVLHGIWAAEALCVWAEDPALPVGRGVGERPRPHPFACQPRELSELLDPVGELVRKSVDTELVLQLPSFAAAPQPSPELASAAANRRRPVLTSWRVPALA